MRNCLKCTKQSVSRLILKLKVHALDGKVLSIGEGHSDINKDYGLKRCTL